ncbi:hypothetical protein [Thiolapillus sp.]
MPKSIITLSMLALLAITNTASAHVGMEPSSWLHMAAHIAVAAAVGIVIVGAGRYFLRNRSKAQWLRSQDK